MAAGIFIGVFFSRLNLDDNPFPRGHLLLSYSNNAFTVEEVEQVPIIVSMGRELAAGRNAREDDPHAILQEPFAEHAVGDVWADWLPFKSGCIECFQEISLLGDAICKQGRSIALLRP